MEHRYKKRENSQCMELRGVPLFKCVCGKCYQTKAQAEQHCRKVNTQSPLSSKVAGIYSSSPHA